ncbi:hypothetical protein D9M73_132360 [compost metagenome]
MWMAGSPKNDGDDSPDRRAHSAAAADRRDHADAWREAPAAQGQDQSVLQPARAGHCRGVVAMDTDHRRARLHRCVPAEQLASAVRPGAGGRSPVGADAGADRHHRRQCPAVRHGPLGQRRFEFSCAVPDPVDGALRRIPHRGPVQPVRVLRGAAGRVLRLDAPRFGPGAGVVGTALHLDQPAGLVAVPDWRGADLWGHRHAEHGRPGGENPAGVRS